jgi:hypothetical protein
MYVDCKVEPMRVHPFKHDRLKLEYSNTLD